MIALDLTELRVESGDRFRAVIAKLDPFQRRGMPCQLVVEIDVHRPVGMAAVLATKDPFQEAPAFPRAQMPGGMSVTEWDRVHGSRRPRSDHHHPTRTRARSARSLHSAFDRRHRFRPSRGPCSGRRERASGIAQLKRTSPGAELANEKEPTHEQRNHQEEQEVQVPAQDRAQARPRQSRSQVDVVDGSLGAERGPVKRPTNQDPAAWGEWNAQSSRSVVTPRCECGMCERCQKRHAEARAVVYDALAAALKAEGAQ